MEESSIPKHGRKVKRESLRTDVEIIEKDVYINGEIVRVKSGTLEPEVGPLGAIEVNLTLLADSFHADRPLDGTPVEPSKFATPSIPIEKLIFTVNKVCEERALGQIESSLLPTIIEYIHEVQYAHHIPLTEFMYVDTSTGLQLRSN